MEEVKKLFDECFDANKDRFNNLSTYIWGNPELSFKEARAHNILTKFLEEEGFQVERNYVTPTGFKATFGSGEKPSGGGDGQKPVHICLFCEYDAVPEVGHGTGHNLSSEASIAAATVIKEVMKAKSLNGKLTVLGTPGEDCAGGTKIKMEEKGAFTDVDLCMMLSPMNSNILYPKNYTLQVVSLKYIGKGAHSSANPWDGRNALDAAVACYNNIALLRQQLKPTWNINGIISKGGEQPNVVPTLTEMKFWIRAPDITDVVLIQQKCNACFVAAGKATGCEAEFEYADNPYYAMEHNHVLGAMYQKYANEVGIQESCDCDALEGLHKGSTDIGNISKIIPCINPAYDIGTKAFLNSVAFHEAAGTPEAHEKTLVASKAMALTAMEVLMNPGLLGDIRREHGKVRRPSANDLVRQVSISKNIEMAKQEEYINKLQ